VFNLFWVFSTRWESLRYTSNTQNRWNTSAFRGSSAQAPPEGARTPNVGYTLDDPRRARAQSVIHLSRT
jgi:hypothetical protein